MLNCQFDIFLHCNPFPYVRRCSCRWFPLIFLCACFCFQKKKQKELKEIWARWTACLQGQPITAVRLSLQHNSLSLLCSLQFAIIAALLLPMSSYCEVGSSINKATAIKSPTTHDSLFGLIIQNDAQRLMHVQIRVVVFVFRFTMQTCVTFPLQVKICVSFMPNSNP